METQIQITALRDLDLTDGLTQYVNKKFQKLEKHFSQIKKIHVTLSVERIDRKLQHKAEAHISSSGHGDIVAHCTSIDMYESIDRLIPILDKQIKKHKDKLKKRTDKMTDELRHE